MARAELDRLKKRAERLAELVNRSAAADLLKGERPRFELTSCYEGLEKLIRQYEK